MSLRRGKVFLLTALAGAVFTVQTVFANTQVEAKKYDLLAVYQLAQKNDAQLAAAYATMKATQEALPQSRAKLLPTLGLSAKTTLNKNRTPNTENFNTNGWNLSLTQPLFNMSSWYTLGQAEAKYAQAEAIYANQQQSLILRVAEAYFNSLRAEDALNTAIAQETAVKQQLDQARERHNVGLIAITDVLEAQAVYDNARVTRILAENTVSVSYEGLRTITNHDVTNVAMLEKNMPVNGPIPNSSDEWVNRAINNNLSLQAARKGLDASESSVRASKAAHLPTINAVAHYAENNTRQDGMPDSSGGAIGLELTFPIFSGGATSSKARQAAYKLDEAQQTYDKNLRTINSSTRNLFRTVNSDVERVDARCQGIKSSESALKATQSGYEVGTRNITDVLDAQQKLYSATGDYLNARYDFLINALKLKQSAGTLAETDLIELNEWVAKGLSGSLPVPVQCRAN